ncbi:SIR2 family NAD-dependent protein deacylase [Pseudoalteromonas sp. NGC95]|uniref:SIR2 family NAD-dependent protein deacylase n=1 Tax=Pseudoalteromonas sp. NGC95 TaxID=2792051 RepID=UPI0018CFB121|nr:SIR2 family protein [Pseudoalteromonas sp. NGC95]MBH0015962.1 SIR2 family protein [Pseudoalteromonas sp. NGC95]
MRFLENGPSIPDELLQARDQGRVVFFCGAGVSRARAGFADFFELASSVTDELGVEASSPALKLIGAAKEITDSTGVEGVVSADRIFGLLEREFLTRDIYKSVAKALTPDSKVDLSAHQTMLKLATTRDGLVRLVTTNFDCLFDLCKPDMRTFIPPKLPDLNHSYDFNGTVYLHGKVNEDGTGAASNGFVLSSSEFGDAYLANGWATSFVKGILERYVVVFVGYSADDPPIQYLLEALNKNSSHFNNIYAFQSGDESYAGSKWRHKGVKAIGYDDSNGHIALWSTLEAWAERASDPDTWYQEIITKAGIGPHQLQPFERGQIAHIVSTTEGAQKFANSEKLVPASWLHVFDSELRYEGPPKSLSGTENLAGIVDPFHFYSLDSDYIPQHVEPNDPYNKREVPTSAWDAFEFNIQDIKKAQDKRVIRFRGDDLNYPQFSTLPQRLNILTHWLSRLADQPEVIWWVTKQQFLHPWIQSVLRSEVERRSEDMNSVLNQAWGYILDGFEQIDKKRELNWFTLKRAIKSNGWCPRKLRHLAMLTRPFIKVTPHYRPPNEANPDQISLEHLIHLDVHYPELPRGLQVPNELLIRTVKILRRNLELAIELENEIGGFGLSLRCSLTPEKNGEDSYSRTHGLSAWVLLFVSYLDKLLIIDLATAQKELSKWPCDDSTIFARLRIWALGKAELVPNESFITILNQLSDEAFWDSYHARDLLLAFKARWKDLDECNRSTIENRILQGPKPWKIEDESGFKERKAGNILDRLTWLKQNSCELTIDTDKLVHRLRDNTPKWKPEYAINAARSFETRSGIVTKNTDYSLLADEPLASILERASELSGRQANFLIDEDPFLGLSQEKPIRAFNALTFSAKKGNIVDWAWDTFLYAEDRKNDKPRFIALIAERLSSFTSDDLAKILRPVSNWFEKSTSVLTNDYNATYFKLAFKLVDAISRKPAEGASSIIRGSKDPDWSMESINSPTGILTSAVLQPLHSHIFESGEGFTEDLLLLLNQLLALPDDLHRYAMVILSRSLSLCFWIDPDWTQQNLLSALNSSSEEDRLAFWTGVLWGVVRGKELFTILKPSILELAYSGEVESRGHQDAIVGLIYSAWKINDENDRWVSNIELKEVLIRASDNFRCRTLWQARHGNSEDKEGWLIQFKELISNVWPKQLAAKSPSVSERLCDIAFWSEEHFPEIVNLITPFLTKLEHANHIYINNDNILKKYPSDLLLLLYTVLPEDINKWPYNIGDYLDKMNKADSELGEDERFIELKRKWDAR